MKKCRLTHLGAGGHLEVIESQAITLALDGLYAKVWYANHQTISSIHCFLLRNCWWGSWHSMETATGSFSGRYDVITLAELALKPPNGCLHDQFTTATGRKLIDQSISTICIT